MTKNNLPRAFFKIQREIQRERERDTERERATEREREIQRERGSVIDGVWWMNPSLLCSSLVITVTHH